MFPSNFELDKEFLKKYFIISFGMAILVLIGLELTNKHLVNNVSPYGIISFELAHNITHSKIIMDSWSDVQKSYAFFNLGLDFAYMICYSISLYLGCLYVTKIFDKQSSFFKTIGMSIARLQFLAAGFDVIENICLYNLLLGNLENSFSITAMWTAMIKFFLIFVGLSFITVNLISYNFLKKR